MLGGAASALRRVWLWYLPWLGQEGVIPYTVMLKAVACLLKKQSGNTGSLQVAVLKGNVRGCFVHPPFPRQDQLSVKQFLKYAVCASYCIRAGVPETELFLPVLTILPQAAAVLSVLTDALVFS